MKVELSIKDDRELRNLMKDLIRGQVVNIVRSEVCEIVAEEVKKKLGYSLPKIIESSLKKEMNSKNLDIDVGIAINKIVTEQVRQDIFDEAFKMKGNYDKVIEAIVKKHMAGIRLKVTE